MYVQDRIQESGELIWKLLEQGAHFYVCGDAAHMAGSVEKALLGIIKQVTSTANQIAVTVVLPDPGVCHKSNGQYSFQELVLMHSRPVLAWLNGACHALPGLKHTMNVQIFWRQSCMSSIPEVD